MPVPSWGPSDPKGWGPPRSRRALQLTEVSILRRLRDGQAPGRIAAALGMNPDSVTRAKRQLRAAFGVDTDRELLEHPDVRSQL